MDSKEHKEHKMESTQAERIVWSNPNAIAEWIVWIEFVTLLEYVPTPTSRGAK